MKNMENVTLSPGTQKSTEADPEMPQMLKQSDKDLNAAIVTVLIEIK